MLLALVVPIQTAAGWVGDYREITRIGAWIVGCGDTWDRASTSCDCFAEGDGGARLYLIGEDLIRVELPRRSFYPRSLVTISVDDESQWSRVAKPPMNEEGPVFFVEFRDKGLVEAFHKGTVARIQWLEPNWWEENAWDARHEVGAIRGMDRIGLNGVLEAAAMRVERTKVLRRDAQ